MHLEIITPDKKVFEGEVTSVQLPGTNGSFEVLQNHAALISTLERGPVKVTAGGNVQTFTIDGGVVEVLKNQVIVMAEAVLA